MGALPILTEEQKIELQKMANRFAESDLRIARNEGVMAITQTKLGNLEVSYNRNTQRYSICNFNNTAQCYLSGVKKAEAKAFIASNYYIEL